jgi:hypothetical protein
MTLRTNILVASFGALTLMAAATPASAVLCVDAQGIPIVTDTNLWESFQSCDIGDKRFTFVSSDVDLDILFTHDGELTYAFNAIDLITGTAELEYTVTVLDPSFFISGVAIDSNVNVQGSQPGVPPLTTVVKDIMDDTGAVLDTITSVDGSTDTSIALNEQFLAIRDTITVAPGDFLVGFSNTFTQMPEPASLGLLGLGLLGLGAVARRRRHLA